MNMKKENKFKAMILAIIIVSASFGFLFGYQLVRANGASSKIFDVPTDSYSFLIWKEDSTYFSKNGLTGEVTSGAVASVLINEGMDAIRTAGYGVMKLIGNITITDTLDLTALQRGTYETGYGYIKPFYLDLQGCNLFAQINAKPILDLTGSLWVQIYGGCINTTSAYKPNVGILMARRSSTESAGQHTIIGIDMRGFFTVSAIYNYGSEENNFFGCYVYNAESGKDALILTSTNEYGVTSPFVTTATGSQSMYLNRFYGGALLSQGNGVVISASSMSMAMGHSFYGVMIAATGTADIYFKVTVSNMYGFMFSGCRFTDLDPSYCFYVNNAGTSRTVSRVMITNCFLEATTNEMKIDTNSIADRWVFDRTNVRLYPKGDSGTFTNSDIYTT